MLEIRKPSYNGFIFDALLPDSRICDASLKSPSAISLYIVEVYSPCFIIRTILIRMKVEMVNSNDEGRVFKDSEEDSVE